MYLNATEAKALGVVDIVDTPRMITQHPLDVLITHGVAPKQVKKNNKKG